MHCFKKIKMSYFCQYGYVLTKLCVTCTAIFIELAVYFTWTGKSYFVQLMIMLQYSCILSISLRVVGRVQKVAKVQKFVFYYCICFVRFCCSFAFCVCLCCLFVL